MHSNMISYHLGTFLEISDAGHPLLLKKNEFCMVFKGFPFDFPSIRTSEVTCGQHWLLGNQRISFENNAKSVILQN